MPRDWMYVRRFLNEPGHHAGPYLLLSVPDTEGARGSYVESSVRFEIADCARTFQPECTTRLPPQQLAEGPCSCRPCPRRSGGR
jgi:hypothetical protein